MRVIRSPDEALLNFLAPFWRFFIMPPSFREIVRNNVKEKLARDEIVASMTVRLVRSVEIARIAATCGFDSLYVDVEHSPFSLDATSQICMAALEVGIAPFVRVPSNGPEYVSRVLDGGALGVIAPHIRSAEEAASVVRYAKFPPFGDRSAGGPLPQARYRNFPVAEANAAMNDATMVVVMMETKAALDCVDEIAAVPGIDMLLIGTNDLCCELGIAGEFDHETVRDAYARTIAACRKHRKHVGVGGLAGRPDLVAKFVGEGARYVSTGSDLSFLLDAGAQRAKLVAALKP
jgi:4-hydroxy-2-oxoheptanedioate aldolase